MRYLKRLPDLVAAIILLQTLWFKFSAAPESVYIFETLGAEPSGRIGSGVAEALAAALLLLRPTAWLGAGLALGIMAGAIGSHLAVLGIEIMGDGGLLFALAVIVALCSAYVLRRDRGRALSFIRDLRGRDSE